MEELRKIRLREIPPVNEILASQEVSSLSFPREQLSKGVQRILDKLRQSILTSSSEEFLRRSISIQDIATSTATEIKRCFESSLQKVVNATGIVLHTNCGRAVLPGAALKHLIETARGYSNLELNLCSGERGSRYVHVEELLCSLTGAEAAMVVNNNAAAVLLVMKALAEGKEVIVSRGELVEVGGAFRIPDVLRLGGALLIEVGTTNKTRVEDYTRAITEKCALLLKVHTSNFRVVGFTQEASNQELVDLGKSLDIPVAVDLGSGTLVDLAKWGIAPEPTVQEVVGSGVDLVTFSGDKLLGGPQAGIIVGRRKYIDALKSNQLTRALRIDKLSLAALEGTLRLYLEERINEIPTLAMLSLTQEQLLAQAQNLEVLMKAAVGDAAEIMLEMGFSQTGGGSLPTTNIATVLVSVKPKISSVNALEEYLRTSKTPILARIQKDKVLFDTRTLLSGDSLIIAQVMSEWIKSS